MLTPLESIIRAHCCMLPSSLPIMIPVRRSGLPSGAQSRDAQYANEDQGRMSKRIDRLMFVMGNYFAVLVEMMLLQQANDNGDGASRPENLSG